MAKKRSYSYESKIAVIEMKLSGASYREVMETHQIKNQTQIETWVRWYRKGEYHRLKQPRGKQYTFGHGPEGITQIELLQLQNKILTLENEALKKYEKMEREWLKSLRLK